MSTGQRDLFAPPSTAEQELFSDASGNRMRFWERYLTRSEANHLLGSIQALAPLEPESVVVGGKPILTRRKSCAFGTTGKLYRYAGAVRRMNPWPDYLVEVLERVQRTADCRFDFVLVGCYPNGEADLSWHGDDERDLEPGAPIGSLSLGAERDFAVRRHELDETFTRMVTQPLPHGSFCTMEGPTFQRAYSHCVPKRAGVTQPRINLTFRKFARDLR